MQDLLKTEINDISGGEESLCACFVLSQVEIPWAVFIGLSTDACMDKCYNYRQYKRKHRGAIWKFKSNPSDTTVWVGECSKTYTYRSPLKSQTIVTATNSDNCDKDIY